MPFSANERKAFRADFVAKHIALRDRALRFAVDKRECAIGKHSCFRSFRAGADGQIGRIRLPSRPAVFGNGDQIVQLVLLLGDNAIKYSPEGSHIRYKTKLLSNGSLEMSVVDNGPGIPEEDLPFIFERFYKVDKSHAHSSSKGTGLGLAIAKEIVRMHGAQIEVFSQVGVGTRFVVTFPAETVVRQDGLQ